MYLRLLNNRVKLTKYTGIGVNRISQSFIHTKSSQLLLNETHSVRSMSLSHTDSATSPKKFDSIPFIQVHKYSTTTFDFASVLFRQKNINRSSFRKFSVLKNTPSKSLENTVEKQFEQTSKNPVEQTPKTPETPIEKNPETQVEQTPENPVEQTPENPVEHTPEKPVEQTPEKPVEKPGKNTIKKSNELTVDDFILGLFPVLVIFSSIIYCFLGGVMLGIFILYEFPLLSPIYLALVGYFLFTQMN